LRLLTCIDHEDYGDHGRPCELHRLKSSNQIRSLCVTFPVTFTPGVSALQLHAHMVSRASIKEANKIVA